MTEVVRLNLKVPKSVGDQWDKWSKEFGVSRTSFLIISSAIGGKALERSMFPERSLSVDLLKNMIDAGLVGSDLDVEKVKDAIQKA